MCGLGVLVGCRMKHAKGMFKRCGLGAALLPARFGVPRSFCAVCKGKRLRAGKRQAWTPIKGFKGFEGFFRVLSVLRV